ncbi:MAG: 2-oxo acid dehydrogenase subunit E2 [Oscillospiraceae bacterium]|nr:2-oxo acid dehydrogenase subunit E2 [Oscillospiraceae bacterium]
MTELIMPKAGMAMEEGKIVRWLKDVGDRIEAGEAIMEIETDKITMETESPAAGILLVKYYEDGDVVPVTVTVGYIGERGETVPDAPMVPSASVGGGVPDAPLAHVPAQHTTCSTQNSIIPLATPYARTLAAQAGVDLGTLTGSGHGGVIKARDVQKVSADAGHADGDTTVPLAGMRAVIAERMTRAAEIPAVTQSMKVYMDDLLALRAEVNEGCAEKVTINDFIIKAAAHAVAESDLFRTEIDMANCRLITRAQTNIGVAVALDEGLMVPVIRDADKLTLTELSVRAKDLAARARGGQLLPDECRGSVFTVTNPGASGIFTFTPIINQPNAAILGVGSLHEELALVGGAFVTRKFVMICLTYDHRIIDGTAAAVFQRRIKGLLEEPAVMS